MYHYSYTTATTRMMQEVLLFTTHLHPDMHYFRISQYNVL